MTQLAKLKLHFAPHTRQLHPKVLLFVILFGESRIKDHQLIS